MAESEPLGDVATKLLFENDGGTSVTIPVVPGDVLYVDRGGVETAVNRSNARFREILIELKD